MNWLCWLITIGLVVTVIIVAALLAYVVARILIFAARQLNKSLQLARRGVAVTNIRLAGWTARRTVDRVSDEFLRHLYRQVRR